MGPKSIAMRRGIHVPTLFGSCRSDGREPLADLAEIAVATGLLHDCTGSPGVPVLAENELWFAGAEVNEWLADGVFYLVSPLDSGNRTEVELSEEQELLLGWLDKNQIQHVRVMD